MSPSALSSVRTFARVGVGFLLVLLGLPSAYAQWRTQEIQLQPGWNAVFLEVDPEPRDCASIFRGMPVESVWMHNPRAGAPQFVSDPRTLTPTAPDWLVYVPGPAGGAVNTLFTLPGGRPYLVKVTGNTAVSWKVTGRPRVAPVEFQGQAFNFVGFHLDPAVNVSVQTFFSPSTALASAEVYDLAPTGEWRLVADRTSTFLKPGRGYWVFASVPTRYSGPLELTPDGLGEVSFGPVGTATSVRVANRAAVSRRLTFKVLPSEPTPSGAPVANAGPVLLSYLPRSATKFAPINAPLSIDFLAGRSDEVRLALRRSEMAPFALPAGATAARYQGLLEVTDGAGVRFVLSLLAEDNAQGAASPVSAARSAAKLARTGVRPNAEAPNRWAGLWAGVVAVNEVNEPRNASDPLKTRPAGGEFQFRVLLHVDAQGTTRLLREALVLFKRGTLAPVPGSNSQELDAPGEYVVATDESLLALRDPAGRPIYSGSTLRDGVLVGRRLSSVNFSNKQPIVLAGLFGESGAAVSGQLTVGFNDPLSPFRHTFHPDHDNKDREFKPFAQGGEESWDVTRALQFEFFATDPDPNAPPLSGFGSETLAGRYTEVITGLHKDPLRVAGIFRIQRVLNVNQLNDGR